MELLIYNFLEFIYLFIFYNQRCNICSKLVPSPYAFIASELLPAYFGRFELVKQNIP